MREKWGEMGENKENERKAWEYETKPVEKREKGRKTREK